MAFNKRIKDNLAWQLTFMWILDPHCRKCGVYTDIRRPVQGKTYPDNSATIQHLHPSFSPERAKYGHVNPKTLTLWCYRCNQRDSAEILQGLRNQGFKQIKK